MSEQRAADVYSFMGVVINLLEQYKLEVEAAAKESPSNFNDLNSKLEQMLLIAKGVAV